MRIAVESARLGLAAGDERCLCVAAAVRRRAECAVLYHTDAPLALDGRAVAVDRTMASLLSTLRSRAPHAASDPIVGTYLASFVDATGYTPTEAGRLVIDEQAWKDEVALLDRHRPVAVTVGGDTLDFALAVGRLDLVAEVLDRYRTLLASLGESVLVFTTYFGPLIDRQGEFVYADFVDAAMLPINSRGLGMLPDADSAWNWAAGLSVPLVAMHPLGAGRIDALSALRYVLHEKKVAITVVGASSYEHIHALGHAARRAFGPLDS